MNLLVKHKNSLSKKERLKGRSIINTLFSTGLSHKYGCIQLIYMEVKGSFFPKILFSVPKSRIPKAYMRNSIRRKMREVYRLHKNLIYYPHPLKIAIGFIYTKRTLSPFLMLRNDIVAHLEWLKEHYLI